MLLVWTVAEGLELLLEELAAFAVAQAIALLALP